MNIVDPILFQCRLNAPAAAIGAPGSDLNLASYGRLERFVHNISRAGHSLGLAAGQTVAISVKDKIFHAAIVFALTRLGVITLSIQDDSWPKELRVDVLISDRNLSSLSVTNVIRADLAWTEGDGRPIADPRAYRGGGDDICRICLTSGTTGEAKAVALSHNMLRERLARFQFALGDRFPRTQRLYSDLSIATAAGFIRALFALWRGGTIFYYGATPEDTLQAFGLYKVESMSAGPFALAEYLKFYEAHPDYPCSFDHIVCLGGHLSKSLSDRVRARMCSNLYSVYGSTEVSTVASAPAHIVATTPDAVGYVVPDAAVEIVNASGRSVASGQEGIVRVRTPTGVSGYLGDPEQSARAFRDGWFYPGDIGRLTSDALLVVSGREDATLNVGGDKVSPEAIETVLASFRGVTQAAVFTERNALGVDEVVALVVANSTFEPEAIRAYCVPRLPDGLVPTRFVPVAELPRNAAGKLDRDRLRNLATPRPN
jgi:acyl-CoA synthetase (AMP-forming)/AMP-acid ligase II